MKTRIRKFFALLITITFFLSIGVFVLAKTNQFGDFTGNNHGSCHDNFGLGSGSIFYISNSGSIVDPGEIFILSLQIKGFTEVSGSELKLGFPSGSPGRGDNKQFTFDTTRESVTLDGSGNSGLIYYQVTAPITEQGYTLVADALYRGGGSGPSYYITVSIAITVQSPPTDITPPDVAIISPSNNSIASGVSIAITGTATDSGSGVLGSSVKAYVTNTTGTNNTISLSYTGPGYSGTWDSTSVFDGDYNITVRAQDIDGNTNVTEYVSVKVDNTAPSITLDSVIPDPSNGITTITASNSSSDIDGNGIRANITDPSSGETYVNLNYQGSNSWNGTFIVTQNGNYDVNINATDFAGNTGIAGLTTIEGDVANPIITINSPLSNALFSSTPPQF